MRRVTLLFLGYQAADFATTALAVGTRSMQELNPIVDLWGWIPFIIFKLFGILIVCIVLQLKRPRKFDILVPAFIAPFIMFNAVQLILAW